MKNPTKLTYVRFYQLVEGVKTHRDKFTELHSWKEAAEWITSRLRETDKDFPTVGDDSLRRACALISPEVRPARKRLGKPNPDRGINTRDDLACLVRHVARMTEAFNRALKELGQLPVEESDGWLALAERVRKL